MSRFLLSLPVSPSGRINRVTWWLMMLFTQTSLLLLIMGTSSAVQHLAGFQLHCAFAALGSCFALAYWVILCTTVKRYHDLGKPGWWCLVLFIPYIGAVWQLLECGFFPGDSEANAFGPRPLSLFTPSAGDLSRPGKLSPHPAPDI